MSSPEKANHWTEVLFLLILTEKPLQTQAQSFLKAAVTPRKTDRLPPGH
jgi:hypothetical protein